MSWFYEIKSTTENDCCIIILFARNSASYQFTLAKGSLRFSRNRKNSVQTRGESLNCWSISTKTVIFLTIKSIRISSELFNVIPTIPPYFVRNLVPHEWQISFLFGLFSFASIWDWLQLFHDVIRQQYGQKRVWNQTDRREKMHNRVIVKTEIHSDLRSFHWKRSHRLTWISSAYLEK